MKKRHVTIVYEIVDGPAFFGGSNPLLFEHNGLKASLVSLSDLGATVDAVRTHFETENTMSADQFSIIESARFGETQ